MSNLSNRIKRLEIKRNPASTRVMVAEEDYEQKGVFWLYGEGYRQGNPTGPYTHEELKAHVSEGDYLITICMHEHEDTVTKYEERI